MAKILSGAPVLLVRDVVAAADYFRDRKIGSGTIRLTSAWSAVMDTP
jgi:hypothetical protein